MAEIFTLTAVAGITLLDAWHSVEGTRAPDVITYLLVGVSIAALVVRRRLPFAVAAICMAALTVLYALGHYGELLNLPTIVALYAVAVQGTRRRTMVVGAYAMAWSALLVWIAHRTWPDFIIEAGSPTLAEMLLPAGALLLGESVRSHRELVNVYEARAVQAEGDREREALRRVEEERLRIARDLHDIVAHTVAGINVQSDVALETFDDRPELAHQALAQVRRSGREALQELRVTVAVLRAGGVSDATEPVPRLDQLEELVERAGINATLKRDGETDRLPSVVELAAYRIIQEGLTNVIRHADGANATVSLTQAGDTLTIDITDDGTATNQSRPEDGATPPGFGLIGMSERAAALGGSLEHGPLPGGGFRVRAVLPLDGNPT